ncbi:MAG: hypothetical protein ACREBF_03015 [Candidatus Micrarchaeales archaeon]
MNNGLVVGGIIVIIIIAAGAFFLLGGSGVSNTGGSTTLTTIGYTTSILPISSQTRQVPIMLTDPPSVPAGTSSFVIAYSSVMVHTNGGGWINVSGSGSANVIALINSTQIIGSANVLLNSTVDIMRFNVTSASITINGTTYAVSAPNSQFIAQVVGASRVNQSASILVDITPTVVAVYNQNSTSFAMTPSSRALLVINGNAQVGASAVLNASVKAQIQAATPSISITSASVSTSGNVTSVSVTVKDNSNSTVTLNNLLVYGQQSTSINANAGLGVNGTIVGVTGIASQNNLYAGLSLRVQSLKVMNFLISSGASLSVPSSTASFTGVGYSLSAGSSVTLTYSGKVVYGNGVTATPVHGSTYNIVVTGSSNARASTQTTA